MAAQHQHEEVELGFAEKCGRKLLLSPLFFPSKLGGKPSWLNWEFLPSIESLKCYSCLKQMIFLCQIYVPIELRNKKYHRTLYIFCCRNGPCSNKDNFVKAFRSQKIEHEDDFNDESKKDNELLPLIEALEKRMTLCNLCGCFAVKSCSSCHNVYYCCKDHQVIDWKSGHKSICISKDDSMVEKKNSKKPNVILFDEYEIVIEPEPTDDEAKPVLDEEKDKYKEYLSKNSQDSVDKQLEKDLKNFKNKKIDEIFLKFKECIDLEPEQILRYQLGGEPLWVSGENIPTKVDIPKCKCGAKRQFEFQILPQMINYLGVETTVDSIDWGVICIYTCVDNCMDECTYKEEFVWKQDFSDVDVVS